MRWIKKYRNKDYKIVKRFALLPIRVGNKYRWLETCYVLKEKSHSWGEDLGWVNISWMTKEEYEIWNKGCKYAQFETECPHRVGDGCKLRYNAYKDDCGDCFRKVGF